MPQSRIIYKYLNHNCLYFMHAYSAKIRKPIILQPPGLFTLARSRFTHFRSAKMRQFGKIIAVFVLTTIFLVHSLIFNVKPANAWYNSSYAWYNSSYLYRKQITLDSTRVSGSANLSNFPILISMTDADLKTTANGGNVQNANGYDIIFVASDDTTKLDHEIEKYVASTGEIRMWVRIPILYHSGNTILYMYYGNGSISTSQENKIGVWDSNYKQVWHMAETSGQHLDSTANHLDSTSVSVTTQGSAAGQIDGADSFNGSSDTVSAPDNAVYNPSTATIEVWVKFNHLSSVLGHEQWVVIKADSTKPFSSFLIRLDQVNESINDRLETCFTNTTRATVCAKSSSSLSAGTWYHVVAVEDGRAVRLYVNGALQADWNTAWTGTILDSNGVFRVSGNMNGANLVDGTIDEVRFSSTARSADWIATEYNNQNSPSTFYTLSSQQHMLAHNYLFGTLETGNGAIFNTLGLSYADVAKQEHDAGVAVANVTLAWKDYETADGVFYEDELAFKANVINTFLQAGQKVDVQLHLVVPSWVMQIPNAYYVNQYGVSSPYEDPNYVFNATVRDKVQDFEQHALQRLDALVGLNNIWAFRIDGGVGGEARYSPSDDKQGHTNSYWAFDANAQGTGHNLPTGVDSTPFPGWRPGDTAYNSQAFTTAQVQQWYDWYFNSRMNYYNWQVSLFRATRFNNYLEFETPGYGTRPDEYKAEINHYLDGSVNTDGTMAQAAVWQNFYPAITNKTNIIAYISSMADGSGLPANNTCQADDQSVDFNNDPSIDNWSGVRYISYIADKYGFLKSGENPGWSPEGGARPDYGTIMMYNAARQMQTCGLIGMVWAHDQNLYEGTNGLSLQDYATIIAQTSSSDSREVPENLLPLLFIFLAIPKAMLILTVGLMFIVSLVTPLNQGTLQGLQRFGWFATITLLSSFLRLVLAIGFVLMGLGVNGAILGIVVSTLLACLISFQPLGKVLKGPRAPMGSLQSLWTYSILALAVTVGIVALYSIDTVLAKHFLSASDAGLYAALATIGRTVLLITIGVTTVMFPRVVALHERGEPHTRVVIQAILGVLILSVPVEIVFYFASSLVTKLLFGQAFVAVAGQLATYGMAMLLLAVGWVIISYFLAMGNRSVVLIIFLACALQIGLIVWHHTTIAQVVQAVIVTNAALLLALLIAFGLRAWRTSAGSRFRRKRGRFNWRGDLNPPRDLQDLKARYCRQGRAKKGSPK